MEKRRRSCGCFWLFLLVFVVGVLLLGWWTSNVYSTAKALQQDLEGLQPFWQSDLGQVDLNEVGPRLHTLREDVVRLRRQVGPVLPITPVLGWVPTYGGDIVAAPALLEMADGLSEGAVVAWDVLEPTLGQLQQQGGNVQEQLLSLAFSGQLGEGVAALEQAAAALQRAMAARARVDVDTLSPTLRRAILQLDELLPPVQQGLALAHAVPVLAGHGQERTYLILALNEDELRAGGGLISAYGLITLRDGQVVRTDFDDPTAADDPSRPHPPAPPALRQFMGTEQWLFHDSNWSPDVPTAARQAISLFSATTPVQIDGVATFDQEALRRLVDTLGPLTILGQEITGDNVIGLLQIAWDTTGQLPPELQELRKGFVGLLAGVLADRLQQKQVDWAALGQTLQELVEEKHVSLYVPDPVEVQGFLAEQGWDGALRPGKQDLLMIVDSNLGANKANAKVVGSILYQVDLSVDTPQAELTLKYLHTAPARDEPCRPGASLNLTYEGWTEQCYWDLVRVYVPGASELSGGEIPAIPAEEMGNGRPAGGAPTVEPSEEGSAVWSAPLVLAPQEQQSLVFRYTLPAAVVSQDGAGYVYRLHVQKQPGARAKTLELHLRLPEGMKAIVCSPVQCEGEGEDVRMQLAVERDLEVVVRFGE